MTGAGGFSALYNTGGERGGEEETCGDEWKGWIMGKNVNKRTYKAYQQEELPEKEKMESVQRCFTN